jgi:hypothetical protein
MTPQQAAAWIVDRHGLPTSLTPFLARLVPRDADPLSYLQAAVEKPTHESLTPFLGYKDQLILRLSILATEVVEHLHFRLSPDWYEELVAESLAGLVEVTPYLNEEVHNIPGYVYTAIRRKVTKRLDWLRLFEQHEVNQDCGSLVRGKRRESELSIFVAACHLYTDFYSCVRDPLERAILELRWNYPNAFALGPAYASDIANTLDLPTRRVVEELELLQRRYLKIVNARRRSKGLRALRPQPIKRVQRPDNCASEMDLISSAVSEAA